MIVAEAGGASTLGGMVMQPLVTDASCALDQTSVLATIKEDDFHSPISRLLCLENTVSGQVQDPNHHHRFVEGVRERGWYSISISIDNMVDRQINVFQAYFKER